MTPDNIRTTRKKLGLSQPQLAALMGRRQASVSDWETGKHSPDGASLRLLQAYADGYRPADWPKTKLKPRKETTS